MVEPGELRFSQRTAQRDCAYCREALGPEPWLCSQCHSALHRDCAAELSACPSLGCSAPLSLTNKPPVRDPRAPWRFDLADFEGADLRDSDDESRLSFEPHLEGSEQSQKRGGALWTLAAFAAVALLLDFSVASLVGLLFLALLVRFLGSRLMLEGEKTVRWRRMRSLSIVAREGDWELIEAFLDSEAPTIRRLVKPLDFDASRAEAGLLHIGDEELRLPVASPQERRRLAEGLERAWRGLPKSSSDPKSAVKSGPLS